MENRPISEGLPGVDGSGGNLAPKRELEKKPRTRPVDRNQMVFYPTDIDALIPVDHEVRAVWQLVGSLDLSSYYGKILSVEGQAGSPAYDPHLLISIWVYAYGKGVSSAREISRLCSSDPAYQWLCAMRPVNYHSLSDFRIAHEASLRELFAEMLGILSYEELITLERVMHDGMKVKACAGIDTFRRKKTVEAHLEMARTQVQAMEKASDEEVGPRAQKARQRSARERQERLTHALGEMEKIKDKKREKRVSMTDPDCRVMGQPDGGYAPSYNVQISTDAKEKAIVAVAVSQSSNDQGLLPSALDRIEATAGCLPGQVVADGGFTNRETIIALCEKKVDFVGSFTDNTGVRTSVLRHRGVEEAFYPEHFLFDHDKNTYICPQGKTLVYRRKSTRRGKTSFLYQASTNDCRMCSFKSVCCPKAKKGRSVIRSEDDPRVVAFIEKMTTDEAQAIYRKRGEVAEFPNAWIKEKFGLRQFRLRGLVKVGIEALWACLTYNIKLWIRLCFRPQFQGA